MNTLLFRKADSPSSTWTVDLIIAGMGPHGDAFSAQQYEYTLHALPEAFKVGTLLTWDTSDADNTHGVCVIEVALYMYR